MKFKYRVSTSLVGMIALGGVVWNGSGPSTYSLKVSPSRTSCSALTLVAPPFYKCSSMDLRDAAGARVGRVDWGFNGRILLLTLEKEGEVTNCSMPATQSLSGGSPTYPSCSAEWTIQSNPGVTPRVSIDLSEYSSGGGGSPHGCRPTWRSGTIMP